MSLMVNRGRRRWGTLAAVAAVLFFRRADAFLYPQPWAEDGVIFLNQARELGLQSLLVRYNGYFHTTQRLIAYLTSFLPVCWAPAVFNAYAFFVTLAVVAYLLSSRLRLPRKSLLALALVACPLRAAETLMVFVNTQWVLAPALFLFIVSEEPSTRARRVFDLSLVVLIGLTGPFALVLLPLLALRAYLRRTQDSLYALLAAAGCAVLQASQVYDQRLAQVHEGTLSWTSYLGRTIGGMLLVGDPISRRLDADGLFTVLTVILFVGLALLAHRRGDRKQLFILGSGLLVILAQGFLLSKQPDLLTQGNRYTYLPEVALLWALILSLDSRWARPIAVTLLTLSALASMTSFYSPQWRGNWWTECHCLDTRPSCEVTIPPVLQSFTISRRPPR